jgi:ribosome-binding factor A
MANVLRPVSASFQPMGNRNLRVNELLKREVSMFVHRHLQSEAVSVTITEAETANDYKTATIYFSVIGDEQEGARMQVLLNKHAQAVNQELRKVIVLRNIPRIRFKHDQSLERGTRILGIMDEIQTEEKSRES